MAMTYASTMDISIARTQKVVGIGVGSGLAFANEIETLDTGGSSIQSESAKLLRLSYNSLAQSNNP